MMWTRLYDPGRTPAHWTSIIAPGQYCVFFLTAEDKAPRDMDGRLFPAGAESTAICDTLDEAEALANRVVAYYPSLCAEIYDHEGKSGEPLHRIYEASVRGRYEGRPFAKRETAIGTALLACSCAMVIYDFRHHLEWMWGYIIGLKLFIIGGSYLVRGVAGLIEHRT